LQFFAANARKKSTIIKFRSTKCDDITRLPYFSEVLVTPHAAIAQQLADLEQSSDSLPPKLNKKTALCDGLNAGKKLYVKAQRAIMFATQENFILSSFTALLQFASGVSKLPTQKDLNVAPARIALPKTL
jgi:hypothetical protein